VNNLPRLSTIALTALASLGALFAETASLPAGTEVVVRTNEYIRTSNATPDHTFQATVERDIKTENGDVLIPRGAQAGLTVRRISKGELAVDLASITVNQIKYSVESAEVNQSNKRDGIGKNKRTGEMLGGGAALGAIIGAVAGGGKGAAVGAVAGAGAGGAAQTLSRGKEVVLPTESVLTFRLSQPLAMAETRRNERKEEERAR